MDKTRFNPGPELCPFDSVKWERLKGIWNCSDQELYHCLPNQYNIPGQICVKPNWVLKNYCPIYNTAAAKIDLIPCDSQYGACSNNDYRSNLVYMYSGCLNKTEILKETTTYTPPIVSFALPLHFIIIIIVAASLLLIFAGSIFFFCRRRKAKYYETGEYQLGQSEIPTGFQKTNDYLKSRVFTSSKFYEHAIGVLDVYRCITIVGPPGCGKTVTALQLASRKCGRGGKSQLYFCQTLEEVLTTAQENNDAYIIVDEFLDKYFYYPSTLDEAVESLNVICNELVIVVVDLICTNKRLLMAMNHVLDDGLTTILKYFFDNWSKDKDIKEKRSFCILVLAAFLGGEISPRNLSGHVTGPVFNRICCEFKCQSDESNTIENETEGKAKRNSNYECDELQSDKELFQTNLRLKSCLFRISRGQDDPLFVFQHSSLLRYVLVYVKKAKSDNFFIQNATLKVLLNNCWLEVGIIDQFLPGKEKTTLESPLGSVSLSTSATKSLVERIFSEVKDGYRIPDWEKHAFMNRKIFSDLWVKSTEAIQMQESGVNECASNTVRGNMPPTQ
uniref:Novel STAND NTPase 3 domain-containing protein n=1 Tax=Magallana gigas TaxID=29159 RepID=A0A8W8N5I3_MAGGI